jgi:ABC-type polysaccharide/polyol phosphate transport system ATPase subunit
LAPSAVTIDRVSKSFTLARRSSGLKERALGAVRGMREPRETRETLWALRDVSLQIPRGETFGLIGPNGCGKSTLLQIVAGILEPDEGSVTANGRITSLLELGAGFSPDLTGRENIFLNASLYGVSRDFIARRFDEIVAFSELERFIDMPVRTYSSGMYVRLGFAVAVHLDPEVILVDEAFAVGDERFQRKCLHTIRDFQKRGTTLVMVSHDLLLIEHLCTRAALLEQGTLAAVGAPADVIGHYHSLNTGRDVGGTGHRWGTGAVQITQVELFCDDRRLAAESPTVTTRDALRVRMHYTCPEPVERPVFGLAIHKDDGVHVTGPNTDTAGIDMGTVAGEGTIDYTIERLPLLPGRYYLSVAVYDHDLITPYDHRDRFVPLVVVEGGTRERYGIVELPGAWSVGGRSASEQRSKIGEGHGR